MGEVIELPRETKIRLLTEDMKNYCLKKKWIVEKEGKLHLTDTGKLQCYALGIIRMSASKNAMDTLEARVYQYLYKIGKSNGTS